MLFYKAEGTVKDGITNVERGYSGTGESGMFSQISDSFYYKHEESVYVFVATLKYGKITMGIVSDEPCDAMAYTDEYLKEAQTSADLKFDEITMTMFFNMLNNAERMNFIPCSDYVATLFDINFLTNRNRESQERIFECAADKGEVYDSAGHTLCVQPLLEELDRIYEGKSYDKFMGNPVHYIIRADREEVCNAVCRTLLKGLYANNRILSRRYTVVDVDVKRHNVSYAELEAIYNANIGGVVYVLVPNEEEKRSMFGSTNTVAEIVKVCVIAKMFAKNVLTIFGINTDCKVAEKKIYECMENISFVEICEKAVFEDMARDYLTHLSDRNDMTADKELYAYIKKDTSYNSRELNEWFIEWCDKKMKHEIFPQYSYTERCAVKIKDEEPQGSAYEELQSMIGLNDVKSVIDKALKYFKAQKLFEARGLKNNKNAMHMVFTGNPGTAKTTVARLFAQIMKDNGILSVGNLVEVGRADLVGKYVGHTAPLVKAKFKEAQGSVLFIDEAYSLLDGDHNTFGVEAINTIVAEMENRRDDIIVIFAGYPEEMKEFLAQNPGMNSRIAFHIGFDDYSAQELYDITELMAQKQNMRFSDDVREKLVAVYEAARGDKTFGNGRYARNIFEKALMNQGARIIDGNIDALSNADMQLITADDFDVEVSTGQKKRVGFAV